MSWANYYCKMGFPIIPLARGTKVPIAKGWDSKIFLPHQFKRCNIGTRVGETVTINGKTGRLFVLDFDSPNLDILKSLCAEYNLPRTACIRTGGNHHGYHLLYLTEFEVRKHSGLSYHGCPIDFMGAKSYIVLPPSEVDHPYKYRIALDEISFLEQTTYDRMLTEFRTWQNVSKSMKKATDNDNSDCIMDTIKKIEHVSSEMIDFVKKQCLHQMAKLL